MDSVKYQHAGLADGQWGKMSFAEQMGNIGSEVSRAFRWFEKNPVRFQASFERAVELMDLSIKAADSSGKLSELCRAREEFCDYFNGNEWGSESQQIQKYYDQFVLLVR
ncbi:MAG: hypothetical protein Q4F61_01415 [Candidatus Saccharibacteria bacterium]|nr:hypothetical protein [Candidatus Saccharibacteria bacterium]